MQRWLSWILAAALAWCGGGAAVAQEDPAAAAPQVGASGEVVITCPWFGVGGVVRPGDWAGLRLGINDSSGKQREVLVRIGIEDADGDTMLAERALTTNPGVVQPLWMYLVLPYTFRQQSVLSVTAYAAVEEAASGPATAGDAPKYTYGAGKLLGKAVIPPRSVLNKTDGILGIVGSRNMGLFPKYAGLGVQTPYLPAGHERTEIVQRLDAASLPDRWQGLLPMGVLVWNDGDTPAALGTEKAAALREWVEHGGHLVVVLPKIGQTWTDEANNPLFEITPRVRVERREGVDLTPYRPLIAKEKDRNSTQPDLVLPKNEVLQTFVPIEGAAPEEAMCILAGPTKEGGQRDCLVVRRLVGTGRVDLIGLDVASSWMSQHGLPDPELFWNPVLGRRGELLTQEEVNSEGRVLTGRNLNRDSPLTLDRDLPELTAQNESAAAGVFIGFVVFVAYWLVAGPLGFMVLKRSGLTRHGWLAFAAAAGVFTAIAWGGARVIRPAQVKAQHVTLLDHVYGQPIQRARSWFSLMIPEYGSATVAAGDPAIKAGGMHNLVTPWEPDGGQASGFPDARSYRLDCKNPDQVTFPTRSTVKQFRFDWAGGPRWKMPRPVAPDGQPGEPIKLLKNGTKDVLQGTLVHELPGELKDVMILVNKGLKDYNRALHDKNMHPLLADVKAVSLPNSWRPGDPLDLSLVDLNPSGAPGVIPADGDRFLKTWTEQRLGRPDSDQGIGPGAGGSGRPADRLMGLAYFPQLEPPNTSPSNVRQDYSHYLQRKASHGYDLGVWFSQPCLIIVGRLEGDNVDPVPPWVSTGGAFHETSNSGQTFVRWVYPLPTRPMNLTGQAVQDKGGAPLPGEGGDEGDGGGGGGGS